MEMPTFDSEDWPEVDYDLEFGLDDEIMDTFFNDGDNIPVCGYPSMILMQMSYALTLPKVVRQLGVFLRPELVMARATLLESPYRTPI